MKKAAMATSGARPSVSPEPRATKAMTRNAVAAMTITLASPAILFRHIAQTAATTQTARSASANSTTPSCQVAIAVVSANANVSVGPSTLAARTLRRTRSSASRSTPARALNHEQSRKTDTAMRAVGRRMPVRSEPVGDAPKNARAATMTIPWT